MSDAIRRAAMDLLAERAGFDLSATTTSRLSGALRDGARRRCVELDAYVRLAREEPAELQQLLDRVTVQETAFFRHPEQFTLIRERLLATLPQPVVVWSAACANGQEAYSVAMLLEEAGMPGRVLATDVSNAALARTRAGSYSARELRGLSEERRARFLERDGDRWTVTPALRARVTVSHHNLSTSAPPVASGACGLVLCRNVLIYLAPDVVERVLRGIKDRLAPGGHLLVGGSESLWHVTQVFDLARIDGVFVYRAATAPSARRPASRRTARPAPVRPAARRVPIAALPPEASAADLFDAGARAAAAGDHAVAVSAFRKAAYVAPEHVLAHVELGLALEGAGDAAGAQRAFRAARGALGRGSREHLEAQLDGYRPEELELLLAAKLEEAA